MNKKNLFIGVGLLFIGMVCIFFTFYKGGIAAPRASLPCALIFFGISIMFFRNLKD